MSVLVVNKFTRLSSVALVLLTLAVYQTGQRPVIKRTHSSRALSPKAQKFCELLDLALQEKWARHRSNSLKYRNQAEALIDETIEKESFKRAYDPVFLAYLHMADGDPERNIKLSKKIINSVKFKTKAYLLTTNVDAYCAMGDFKKAALSLDESERISRSINADDPSITNYYRVRVEIGLGNYERATKLIDKMEQEQGTFIPGFISGLRELITLNSMSEREATEVARRQIKVWDSESPRTYENLQYAARLLEKSGHYQSAKIILDKIEELRGE